MAGNFKKKEENKDILQYLQNKKFKLDFIKRLNKLGFPLEFKVRSRLMERGYNNVKETFFTAFDGEHEITKSFDISGHKDKEKVILEDLKINIGLHLIGDCKYYEDKEKFLFAVPDTSNPKNKVFIGPLLSAFQKANYGVYRNQENVSHFISKFGDIFFASNIMDTSKANIMGNNSKKNKIQDHEKVFNIIEDTVLPALKENFVRWRSFAFSDYVQALGRFEPRMSIPETLSVLRNQYFLSKFLVPVLVTSKPILKPIINEENGIEDLKEAKFVLYEHSVLRPNDYVELLGNSFEIGVFICNEKYLDEFIDYIEGVFEKTFDTITNNLAKHPHRLIEDFKDIEKQDDEIQKLLGRGLILPFRKNNKK